mmetsp:Transcript_107534/g.304063  ORF Transcript_107534/g.304063 Transcript_107534/m.304063 type:complete len:239 (+) Transcript_107534:807-1523(+)
MGGGRTERHASLIPSVLCTQLLHAEPTPLQAAMLWSSMPNGRLMATACGSSKTVSLHAAFSGARAEAATCSGAAAVKSVAFTSIHPSSAASSWPAASSSPEPSLGSSSSDSMSRDSASALRSSSSSAASPVQRPSPCRDAATAACSCASSSRSSRGLWLLPLAGGPVTPASWPRLASFLASRSSAIREASIQRNNSSRLCSSSTSTSDETQASSAWAQASAPAQPRSWPINTSPKPLL